MRFLAVFLPRLSTDRLLRRRGASAREAPFALFAKIGGADRLTAVDARADALGLAPGMAAADARAMHPGLALEEADPRADAALLEAIADWHRRFTPLAALDPPDGVMLDISGAAHLFGGEAALSDDIERRLAGQGFAARCAIAPGPALARALARFSRLRRTPPRAAGRDIDAIAARLPVAAFGLGTQAQAAFARAGLRQVGDLMTRPRGPLAARFGPETLTRLDALLCRIRDPITPRFEAPDFMAERRFPEGLARLADIEATLAALAGDLCLLLERHGVGARRLEAVFYRVDGAVKRLAAGTSRPLRDPARLAALLRERLAVLAEEGLDTGYGFDVLRLCAIEIENCETPQTALAGLRGAAPPEAGAAQDLADLIDRLGARLGLRRVLRLHPQETHIPEFAVAAIPAVFGAPQAESRGRPPAPAAAPPRPLRLFERPEPIDAVALTPDGPPLRFRWRRAVHEIIAYEGPERIAPQWWRAEEGAFTRDYFHAQDKEGRCFWLFREGLYERESVSPRWFVHGLS